MQALPSTAESLCIIEMGGAEAGDKVVGGGLFLNIGLNVGSFYKNPAVCLDIVVRLVMPTDKLKLTLF